MSRKALGRGLGALIPEKKPDTAGEGERVENIPVDEIVQSRFQPRIVFNEESLEDLANSISEKGVIQPIIVAKKQNGFELVAGERRWRAVKSLGLETIPAIVKIIRDSDALELALIENIQRENLNPIEEAAAYDRLMREYALTQEALSKKVGKKRSSIANYLRLLKLPNKIKDDLSDGRLTMGHARALLGLDTESDQLKMRDQIVDAGLNVREVESHTRKQSSTKQKKSAPPADIFLERVRIDIERKLAAQVTIKPKKGGGSINITYTDTDDLNRIIELIG